MIDDELKAIRKILTALEGMEQRTRSRVIRYVCDVDMDLALATKRKSLAEYAEHELQGRGRQDKPCAPDKMVSVWTSTNEPPQRLPGERPIFDTDAVEPVRCREIDID